MLFGNLLKVFILNVIGIFIQFLIDCLISLVVLVINSGNFVLLSLKPYKFKGF